MVTSNVVNAIGGGRQANANISNYVYTRTGHYVRVNPVWWFDIATIPVKTTHLLHRLPSLPGTASATARIVDRACSAGQNSLNSAAAAAEA